MFVVTNRIPVAPAAKNAIDKPQQRIMVASSAKDTESAVSAPKIEPTPAIGAPMMCHNAGRNFRDL